MDPNGIVGSPTDREVYLAPDWSATAPVTGKQPAGYTRVKVRTVLYNNGRRVTYVLDANGQPVAAGGAPAASLAEAQVQQQEIDPDQQRIWQQQQSSQQRGDQEGDTRGSQTGPTREVYRSGKWVVEQNPVYRPDPGSEATDKNAAALQAQREKNAALPPDQDPAYETDKERRERSDARIKEQGAAAKAAEDKARQDRIDAEARAEKNKPGPATIKPDGKGGSIAVQTMPDGTIKTTPLPDVPSEATSKYTEVKQDPTTGKWQGLTRAGTWEEMQGGPGLSTGSAFNGSEEGAPALGATQEEITRGLQTYSSWLAQQVKQYHDSGGTQGVSPADATAKMEQRVKVADAVMRAQGTAFSNQSTLRNQDITQRANTLQDTQGRRAAASGIYENAQSNILPLVRYAGHGGGGLALDALEGALRRGREYVDSFGGLRESPEVGTSGFPALDQLRQNAMNGIQTAASGGPVIFQARPVTAPQAGSPLLGPPPAVGADPIAARGANEAAAQASIEQANAGQTPPMPVTGAPAPAPVMNQPPAAPPPVPVVNNPVSNQPIAVPSPMLSPSVVNATTGATHGLIDNLVRPPVDPASIGAPEPPPAGAVPPVYPDMTNPPPADPNLPPNEVSKIMPRFIQQQRYGQAWDPEQSASELSQRLGIDPEIMKQALAGLYG